MFKKSFKDRQGAILSVFSSTRNQLETLNEEIAQDSQVKLEALRKLEEEMKTNSEMMESNTRVIENIDSIIK